MLFIYSCLNCREGTGTGFIGRMELNSKFTFVLMTNCHVLKSEDVAKRCSIEFHSLPGQRIYLSDLIEEEEFYLSNSRKEVNNS